MLLTEKQLLAFATYVAKGTIWCQPSETLLLPKRRWRRSHAYNVSGWELDISAPIEQVHRVEWVSRSGTRAFAKREGENFSLQIFDEEGEGFFYHLGSQIKISRYRLLLEVCCSR